MKEHNNTNTQMEDSLAWLEAKINELSLSSIEEIETFAQDTPDQELAQIIHRHLEVYMSGLYSFLILANCVSSFKVELSQDLLTKTIQIEKRDIINIQDFKLETAASGNLLILSGDKVKIVSCV